MGGQAAVIEALETRTFLSSSGTGADTVFGAGLSGQTAPSHHHLRHHFHQRQRHHYHQPHTVTPDILFGHFVGTAPDAHEKNVELTLGQDAAGNVTGMLLLDGLIFDSEFSVVLYSDNRFIITASGETKSAGLRGSVIQHATQSTVLRGTFGFEFGGGGNAGNFIVTKS